MKTITVKELKNLIEHWGIPAQGALADRLDGEVIDIETGLIVAEWVAINGETNKMLIGSPSILKMIKG